MSIETLDDRPPYVRFEMREEEDRTASIAAGHYVGKDVPMAIITRPGSRDDLHKKAEEWLKEMKVKDTKREIPGTWYSAFASMYESWKKGETAEVNGTPIKGWSAISAASQKTILAAGILTVEDLANTPDQNLDVIGTGALSYKLKAKAFIAQMTGPTAQAAKMAELQAQMARMQATMDEQAKIIDEAKRINSKDKKDF